MSKKYAPGITEKRLRNRRFRKTEEAILRVFFEEDNYISMGKLADKAGVARSTIYNHHKAIREIVPDYRKYILRKYKRMIKKNKASIKGIYEKTMIFMIQNKRIFEVMIRSGEQRIIKDMIAVAKWEIASYARLPKQHEKMWRVYVSEVTELIDEWGNGGFGEEEMGTVMANLIYLTDTLRPRLRALERN